MGGPYQVYMDVMLTGQFTQSVESDTLQRGNQQVYLFRKYQRKGAEI